MSCLPQLLNLCSMIGPSSRIIDLFTLSRFGSETVLGVWDSRLKSSPKSLLN